MKRPWRRFSRGMLSQGRDVAIAARPTTRVRSKRGAMAIVPDTYCVILGWGREADRGADVATNNDISKKISYVFLSSFVLKK